MSDLIQEEEGFIRVSESENVGRIKRLLMMSVNGTLHIHALRLIRRELGLPQDFRESIIGKYTNEFRLVDLEIVGLVDRDRELGFVGEVEKWREKEFREKWLTEFETKYAFPINFPTGFKIEAGFRGKLRNWQRLPYVKPYERKAEVKVRSCGGIERFEKRAVGILHELLWLTVEKKVEVERLVHFRKDLGIEVNLRELILKHPGIFYISTKGSAQTVFLREAYGKGCLMEPNQISVVRRKMLDLILPGRQNTIALRTRKETRDENSNVVCNEIEGVTTNGDWVIPFIDGLLLVTSAMGTPYVFLHEISDCTIKWIIKVRIVWRVGPSYSRDGKLMYKQLILIDEKLVFVHNAGVFNTILMPNKLLCYPGNKDTMLPSLFLENPILTSRGGFVYNECGLISESLELKPVIVATNLQVTGVCGNGIGDPILNDILTKPRALPRMELSTIEEINEISYTVLMNFTIEKFQEVASA
ncbi:unnamed protein product [Camellia sinensis]